MDITALPPASRPSSQYLRHLEIHKWNQELISACTSLDNVLSVKHYFDLILPKFFDVDFGFVLDFHLYLAKLDEFSVPHSLLRKYGVVQSSDLAAVKKSIMSKSSSLLAGTDYIEEEEKYDLANGGWNTRTMIYLTPDSFKKCLMRSRNTDKYANYYLALERCVGYYNEYQTILLSKFVKTILKPISRKTFADNSDENRIKTFLQGSGVQFEDLITAIADNRASPEVLDKEVLYSSCKIVFKNASVLQWYTVSELTKPHETFSSFADIAYEYMSMYLLSEELQYLKEKQLKAIANDILKFLSICPSYLGSLLDLYLVNHSKEVCTTEISQKFSMQLRASILKDRLSSKEPQALGLLLKPAFQHLTFDKLMDIAH
jgi:hypothetical protein